MQDTFAQALQAMRAGRPEEAADLSQRVLVAAPGHIGALNLLAQIRFKAGVFDEVETLLRRAGPARHNRIGTVTSTIGRSVSTC